MLGGTGIALKTKWKMYFNHLVYSQTHGDKAGRWWKYVFDPKFEKADQCRLFKGREEGGNPSLPRNCERFWNLHQDTVSDELKWEGAERANTTASQDTCRTLMHRFRGWRMHPALLRPNTGQSYSSISPGPNFNPWGEISPPFTKYF